MKILYNHQVFHQKYGGISRYFVELANNIALYKNQETSVKIISPFFKTDYLSNKNQKFLLSGLKVPDYTSKEDLVHPNLKGYKLMESVILKNLK